MFLKSVRADCCVASVIVSFLLLSLPYVQGTWCVLMVLTFHTFSLTLSVAWNSLYVILLHTQVTCCWSSKLSASGFYSQFAGDNGDGPAAYCRASRTKELDAVLGDMFHKILGILYGSSCSQWLRCWVCWRSVPIPPLMPTNCHKKTWKVPSSLTFRNAWNNMDRV